MDATVAQGVTLGLPLHDDGAFRQLADTVPVMIWRSNSTGACDFFNRAWLDFTGRRLEQELGTGWTDGVHPDDAPDCLRVYAEAVRERRSFQMQYRLRDRHGRWRWLLDNGQPYAAGPDNQGFLGSCVDVTDAVEAMAARARAEAQREALVAELEHRVLNNAQVTASFLGMQANRAGDPSVAGALRGAATRVLLASMVQDRMFRMPDAGRVALGPELAAAARGALELTGRAGVQLDVQLETEIELPVSRATALALIVNELVVNAARHAFPADRPGRILLLLRRAGPATAEVVVRDNGIGLPGNGAGDDRQGPIGMHLMLRLARQARATMQVESHDGTQASLLFAAA